MKYLNITTGETYDSADDVCDKTSCSGYYDIIMALSSGTLIEL